MKSIKNILVVASIVLLAGTAFGQYADPNQYGQFAAQLYTGTNAIAATTTNTTAFGTYGATTTNTPVFAVKTSNGGKLALMTQLSLTAQGTTNWVFFDWRKGVSTKATNTWALMGTNTSLLMPNYETSPGVLGYWVQCSGTVGATVTTVTNWEVFAPMQAYLVGIWNTNGGAITNLLISPSAPNP